MGPKSNQPGETTVRAHTDSDMDALARAEGASLATKVGLACKAAAAERKD